MTREYCYEHGFNVLVNGPCPSCPERQSRHSVEDTIATLTSERDTLRDAMRARTEQAAADLASMRSDLAAARADAARLRAALEALQALGYLNACHTPSQPRCAACRSIASVDAALAGSPASARVLSAAEERVAARAVALLMLRCGLREFVVRPSDLDASPVETVLTSESVPEGVRYTVTGGAPASGEWVEYVEPDAVLGEWRIDDTAGRLVSVGRPDADGEVCIEQDRTADKEEAVRIWVKPRALAAALLSAAREVVPHE